MRFAVINNFEVQLAAPLTAGATTMDITEGGERFASATLERQYPLVVCERDIRGRDLRREILYVTGRAANTLTIVRSREATAADAWPAGSPVESRFTAAILDAVAASDALDAHEAASDPHPQYEQKAPGSLDALRPVVLRSAELDLTTAGAAVTVAIPAGYRLFLDAIDLVVTASDGAGGVPEVQAGPDDQTPAAYLASTAVTVAALNARQSEAPLVADGLTAVRVATTVAGSGTAYSIRALLYGYLLAEGA
ncbi:hypothetical protein RAN53_12285 [Halomonas sp. SSL-5]|uniref:hypothetical protein n=1 Tax=Halomonas sp. SSL-5 TaxID=3065855 RepID=UPI002739664D|nr:hypothetical protein [Halomonas sp. SSL-5]MDY7117124.1 hypothetical protein [Halomonas sp. SSL-5]